MKVARGQSVYNWTPISATHWKMFATIHQLWEGEVYELAPGEWGAAAVHTVTKRAWGTVKERFASADEARAAIERLVSEGAS